MKAPNCYVDTNLIIARYKPTDELYDDSNKFFNRDLNFIISPITLVELHCVLSRVRDGLDIPLKGEPLIETLVAFVIKDCNLKLLSRGVFIKRDFAGYAFRMSLEQHLATRLAGLLGLKTLDVLHLSYARMLRDLYDINMFITGDEEILKKAEDVKRNLGIKLLHPRQVIRA